MEFSLENSASRANVSLYSLCQPIHRPRVPAATTNCYQRLFPSYEISTLPRLQETRLVRLLQRRTNLHLHADQQWLQRHFAEWGQYLPPQPSLPGCQPSNKQKASASSNRNRSDRNSQCGV